MRRSKLYENTSLCGDALRAVILMIFERRISHRLKRVSWNVVLFVIGLFIVVKGLDVSGVASTIGETLFANISNNILAATF